MPTSAVLVVEDVFRISYLIVLGILVSFSLSAEVTVVMSEVETSDSVVSSPDKNRPPPPRAINRP